MSPSLRFVFVLGCCALAGCASDGVVPDLADPLDAATSPERDASVPTDLAAAPDLDVPVPLLDLAQPTVSVSGHIYSNDNGDAFTGGAVAALDEDGVVVLDSTTTDASGQTLNLPLHALAFVRMDVAGYKPFLRGFYVPPVDSTDTWIESQATYDQWAQDLQTKFQPDAGCVWISFENAGDAGYSGAITPPGLRAFTRDHTYKAQWSTATVEGGGDFWWLQYANVPQGKTDITVSAPAGHFARIRTPLRHWLVLPGVVTYLEVDVM